MVVKMENKPIFPLKSIVLPGGLFPLRIFERRYLDMVRDAIKNDTGFCIALVKTEVRNQYIEDVYPVASSVKIVDWDQLEDGILGITVEGKHLVNIISSKLEKNNLLVGDIEDIEPEKEYMIPDKYRLLSKFYKKIYPGIKNFIDYKKERYSDASWVGYRLTECLPLDLKTKANLISSESALVRLEKIHEIIHKLYREELKVL